MQLTLVLLGLTSLAAARTQLGDWNPDEEEVTIVEEEMVEDPDEDAECLHSTSMGDLPESLYVPDMGIMPPVMHQGYKCGSCGWVSGTQTLAARMAYVSENYLEYSIQNLMNCDEMVCKAQQPYHVPAVTRKHMEWLVRPEEAPYTKKACTQHDPPTCTCRTSARNYTRVMDEQFAFIGPSISVCSEEALLQALQSGPVTTCFNFNSAAQKTALGERCKSGCGHANSIIGYSKDHLYLQESWGKGFGRFNNGTWPTTRGSACATNVINKGSFPMIFYDYDRANAYFTETTVDEEELTYVDRERYGITADNTDNIGLTKNKCAYLGSACKGVVTVGPGRFELVADFGAGNPGTLKSFRKTQMVVYLRHEDTGLYIGLNNKNPKKKILIGVERSQAAPFFTSHNRFVSFDLPEYHMVNNRLAPISEDLRDIDVMEVWRLKDCNLHSTVSGLSLDLVDDEIYGKTIGGRTFNRSSTSQRFDIGISGEWLLKSRGEELLPLRREKSKQRLRYIFSDEYLPQDRRQRNPYYLTNFRWNARQIMTSFRGKAIDHVTMKLSDKLFDFADISENAITPTDCVISKLIDAAAEYPYLTVKNGKVAMAAEMDGRWSFEYGDL